MAAGKGNGALLDRLAPCQQQGGVAAGGANMHRPLPALKLRADSLAAVSAAGRERKGKLVDQFPKEHFSSALCSRLPEMS